MNLTIKKEVWKMQTEKKKKKKKKRNFEKRIVQLLYWLLSLKETLEHHDSF